MYSVEILTSQPQLILDIHQFEKVTSKDIEFQVDVYKEKSKRFWLISGMKMVVKPVTLVAKSIDRFIQRYIPRNEPFHRKYSQFPTAESVKIHVQRYEKKIKKKRPLFKFIPLNEARADIAVVNVKTTYPVSVWRKV
jgi:hypothetical protein